MSPVAKGSGLAERLVPREAAAMTDFAAFRGGVEATRSGQAKTAFVFAGGGSFGSIQVGMLRALVAHGVTADMVVGSSVGAMNAAYYASNPTPEGIELAADLYDLSAEVARSFDLRVDPDHDPLSPPVG